MPTARVFTYIKGVHITMWSTHTMGAMDTASRDTEPFATQSHPHWKPSGATKESRALLLYNPYAYNPVIHTRTSTKALSLSIMWEEQSELLNSEKEKITRRLPRKIVEPVSACS